MAMDPRRKLNVLEDEDITVGAEVEDMQLLLQMESLNIRKRKALYIRASAFCQ